MGRRNDPPGASPSEQQNLRRARRLLLNNSSPKASQSKLPHRHLYLQRPSSTPTKPLWEKVPGQRLSPLAGLAETRRHRSNLRGSHRPPTTPSPSPSSPFALDPFVLCFLRVENGDWEWREARVLGRGYESPALSLVCAPHMPLWLWSLRTFYAGCWRREGVRISLRRWKGKEGGRHLSSWSIVMRSPS